MIIRNTVFCQYHQTLLCSVCWELTMQPFWLNLENNIMCNLMLRKRAWIVSPLQSHPVKFKRWWPTWVLGTGSFGWGFQIRRAHHLGCSERSSMQRWNGRPFPERPPRFVWSGCSYTAVRTDLHLVGRRRLRVNPKTFSDFKSPPPTCSVRSK